MYYKFKDKDNEFYKTVLMPIRVCQGDCCWDGYRHICGHFDNEGGHAVCTLGIGEMKTDKEGRYIKPKSCMKLKNLI